MTPEPALRNRCSCGAAPRGRSKKRRKKGSWSRGFCAPVSCTVPRVDTFTTAGETFLIIGASDGNGVSPTAGGMAAEAGGTSASAHSPRARNAALILSGNSSPRRDAGPGPRREARAGGAVRRRRILWRLCLGGLDFDAPRLGLRTLRNAELEHAVHVRRLDGPGVGALREREAAQERAARTLDALVALARGLLLGAALAADREHALVGRDLDVLAIDTRQVGRDHEALILFADVDARDPADARRIGVAEGLIELAVQPPEERPRLVTNDSH